MKPALFEGHDIVLGAPAGWDAAKDGECHGLPIMREKGACVSLWEATPDERISIAGGANIWLTVVSGQTQPPVSLRVGRIPEATADDDVRRIILYGGPKPQDMTLVDVFTGRRIKNVHSFTLIGVPNELLIANLTVWDFIEPLGDRIDDLASGFGLGCLARIIRRLSAADVE